MLRPLSVLRLKFRNVIDIPDQRGVMFQAICRNLFVPIKQKLLKKKDRVMLMFESQNCLHNWPCFLKMAFIRLVSNAKPGSGCGVTPYHWLCIILR